MSSKDSVSKTLIVALSVCLVCSIVVSASAVLLKPTQLSNKKEDFQRNILSAAGLLQKDLSVAEQFEKISTRYVDLETGNFVDDVPEGYDPRKAARDPMQSVILSKEEDIAKLNRREKIATVFIVKDGDKIDKVILPIKGYGLWSTLYGFLALESDLNTVAGLGFYEHAETPGLGGEVDNPNWKAQWVGKRIYKDGEVELEVIKGKSSGLPEAAQNYTIDGLSGATLTTKGIDNLVKYWMGDDGYKPFLANITGGDL